MLVSLKWYNKTVLGMRKNKVKLDTGTSFPGRVKKLWVILTVISKSNRKPSFFFKFSCLL